MELEGVINTNISRFLLNGAITNVLNLNTDENSWSVTVKRQGSLGYCILGILLIIYLWIHVRRNYRNYLLLLHFERIRSLIRRTITETPEFGLPVLIPDVYENESSSDDEILMLEVYENGNTSNDEDI